MIRPFKDLTPTTFTCGIMSSCPALLKREDGKYYIIGSTIEHKNTPLETRVAEYESVVELPAGMIEAAAEAILKERIGL